MSIGHRPENSSADFQSAVSQIFNRLSSETAVMQVFSAAAECNSAIQIANLRYPCQCGDWSLVDPSLVAQLSFNAAWRR
jgi:hypothetical protein